ncbi:MAG TPA: hypothetical protein VFM02_01820 [Candidatus Paceibacterota bacterium]|nr:hypothetical protein [Candidatus Paceibacterota bacterium]
MIAIALLALFFSRGSITTKISLLYGEHVLAHFKAAQKITDTEFDDINSETAVMSQVVDDSYRDWPRTLNKSDAGSQVMVNSELVDYINTTKNSGINDYNVPSQDLVFTPDDSHVVVDDPAKKFYLLQYEGMYSALNFGDPLVLKVIPQDLTGNPTYKFLPVDKEWESTGGLSCFSCGCSCYYEENLEIANGHFYVNVNGKDFAIRPERQGIYYFDQNKNSWDKLTPKTDGANFKISNAGCTISYKVNSQAFSLDV